MTTKSYGAPGMRSESAAAPRGPGGRIPRLTSGFEQSAAYASSRRGVPGGLGSWAMTELGTVGREPLVVLDHVDKWFGQLHVLQDINLTIGRGEVVVVIGPSGSGKSTLCRTVNRLETVDKGSITLDGVPLPAEGKALA